MINLISCRTFCSSRETNELQIKILREKGEEEDDDENMMMITHLFKSPALII